MTTSGQFLATQESSGNVRVQYFYTHSDGHMQQLIRELCTLPESYARMIVHNHPGENECRTSHWTAQVTARTRDKFDKRWSYSEPMLIFDLPQFTRFWLQAGSAASWLPISEDHRYGYFDPMRPCTVQARIDPEREDGGYEVMVLVDEETEEQGLPDTLREHGDAYSLPIPGLAVLGIWIPFYQRVKEELWRIHASKKDGGATEFERSLFRPANYWDRTDEERWAIDKSLGILDWAGECNHGRQLSDCEECRGRAHYLRET